MEPLCFLNGEVLPVSQAKVGVYDIGLLRGFGIYEALRSFNRRPFRLSEHLERLHRSANALTLTIPEPDERIGRIVADLIEKNIALGSEAVVRFILTGGDAVGGLELSPGRHTFYILVETLVPIPQETLETGCSLLVHEHRRFWPEYKTTNYITAVLLQEERKRAGALEILYTAGGKVLEPATSNIFFIKEGRIITPKADILEGITRKVTLEIARANWPVEERDVSVEEMYAADEAFLTSSFKDVVPVVSVGGKKIGDGLPGPVTKRVMRLFHEFALKN